MKREKGKTSNHWRYSVDSSMNELEWEMTAGISGLSVGMNSIRSDHFGMLKAFLLTVIARRINGEGPSSILGF
jgi:hypothetical protein